MITTQTPAEIDKELARLWSVEQTAMYRISSLTSNRSHPADSPRFEGVIAEYRAEAQAARTEAEPYEAEFTARGGWRRYFLCTATAGHVHRGTHCTTCFQTTTYCWLTELSACDEQAMVAEWGEKACTICFPAAPTFKGFNDGTSSYARRTVAEQAERDAEKAAKQAVKDAKSITAPDGSPLRVGYDTLRTKVAARNALSGAVQSYGWYGPGHPHDFADQIATLIAALEAAGVETQPVIDRAAKKVIGEGGQYDFRGRLVAP